MAVESNPQKIAAVLGSGVVYNPTIMESAVELVVQDHLTHVTGQVWCSDDPSHHNEGMLPCERCGAAI